MVRLTPPVPLRADHDVTAFQNQHDELVRWLQRRARDNEAARGSRCFVVYSGNAVIGYYALAAGAVERAKTPGAIRRNMPEPISAVVLGRLAVDTRWQGQGLGADLLQNAVLRALRASREIGARVLLCHAIDAQARAFYLHHGFIESTFDPLALMLDLRQAEAVLLG